MTGSTVSPSILDSPKDIFEKLWEKRGSSFTARSSEESGFLSEAMGAGLEYTGQYRVDFPSISDNVLGDWNHFRKWLDDVSPAVSFDDFDFGGIDLWAEGAPTPKELLGSELEIRVMVLDILRNMPLEDVGLACVGVRAGERTLIMLYEDLDGWALGHCDTVMVLERLEELTEEKGFYEL